jgi:rRNA maturation endonuclease Nob1
VIYLDTSVALAHLLAEDRRPAPELWSEELVSSRLLDYELWTRLHARDLAATHGDVARLLLARVARLALYLRQQGQEVELATYDGRMAGAAHAMGITLSELNRT